MATNSENFYAESTTGLPLGNLDPVTLQTPTTRIQDARAGRNMFLNMRWDDQKRNMMRSRHQAMLDNQPPYDQALRAAKGQGALTNVNWGDAKNVVDNFMGGILDMKDSVETLLYVPLPRLVVPDDGQRKNFENILGQEITRAIRMWKGFDQAYLTLGHWFGAHGVGIAYFDDVRDWRFLTTGLGDFVIPDGAEASENSIEVAACLRYEPLHKMYEKIRDEAAATKMGWNVEMVKKAMVQAVPENIWNGLPTDWQRLESFMRNNDLGMGYGGGNGTAPGNSARTAKVPLIHMWVQEFDGKVTKYVTTLEAVADYKNNANASEPWLYEKLSFYAEMQRGMVFFPYGIGDNGTYHAVSGICRAIFPQVNALNRSQCQMLDAAMMGCAMKIQPINEASMSRMNIVPLGPIWLMPSAEHGNIIEQRNPDVAQSVMPVIADLRGTISSRAGQFQGGDSPINSSQEKTRFQVAAELEQLGKVGSTQAKLWYSSLVWLWRETSRRLCNPTYPPTWPGGKEAQVFRDRLKMRGFPVELLGQVDFDGITVNQSVGSGSGAARIGRLESLRELSPEMDDVGRYNLNRDLTAAALGGDYDAASRYMPERPGTRPPVDVQFADLENMLMKLKQEPVIEVNQDGFAHLSRHVPFLGQMIESTEKSEVPVEEIIEAMVICFYHCSDTLEQVEQSQVMQEQVAQYRQTIQQQGAFVINLQRKVLAEQMREAEKAQEEGAEQGQQMEPALQEKAIAARLKLESMKSEHELQMEFDAQTHEQDMAMKQEKFSQDMAMKDGANAANLLLNTRKQLSDLRLKEKQKLDAMEIAKMKRASQKSPTKSK